MKTLALSLFAGLALSGGHTLATKYSTDRMMRFEIESTVKMRTTSMEFERDGEPVEGPAGGGASTEATYTEVHVDHALAVEDGKPMKLRRKFEKVGGSSSFTAGEMSRDTDLESSFEGVTLELVSKDGEIDCEVVEGSTPDGESPLEGHRLATFLDGLLPDDAVDVDGTWDLEKDAILHALRLDVRKALYARPAPSGEGERGGGRRGQRGGGGGGSAGVLENADWKGTAKLIATDKEIDGVACSVVEIKLEASGSRELPAMGGGRRGGAFGIEAAFENTVSYDVMLQGKLMFANKEKRPVSLVLDGTLHTDSRREFTRGETSTKTHIIEDGRVEVKVEVSQEAVSTEK